MPDSEPQYDVGYGTQPEGGYNTGYQSLQGYIPSSAADFGYGPQYGYVSQPQGQAGGNYGNLMANAGQSGQFAASGQGLANMGMGIYDLLSGNSQNQYQQLMNMPFLQGNISTMQNLVNQLGNTTVPQYALDAASNYSQRANALNGVNGPLAASVNAQNQTKAQQMYDQWRVGALMNANQQLGALQAAQYQRDAALKAGQMNAQNQDWSSILGGAFGIMGQAGDFGASNFDNILKAFGGGGGGIGALAMAL